MKVPAAFLPGSTRFFEGCGVVRGGFEVHRVPQSSARIPQGFQKAPQCSTKGSRNVLQGSVVCPGGKQCVVRPSLKSYWIKIAMGGPLSKTELNGFQHTFTVLSLARATRPEMLALWQIRSRRCETHGAAE